MAGVAVAAREGNLKEDDGDLGDDDCLTVRADAREGEDNDGGDGTRLL